jgi:hypothetical protein
MGVVACPCCGRRKAVKPIPRGARFRCTSCGCRDPLILMRDKGTDRSGVGVDEAMRQTLAGLMRIAEYRGFKPGWAFFKFKRLFGRDPPQIDVKSEPAIAELRLWVKKQARIWAKAKRMTESPALPLEVASELMTGEDWGAKL